MLLVSLETKRRKQKKGSEWMGKGSDTCPGTATRSRGGATCLPVGVAARSSICTYMKNVPEGRLRQCFLFSSRTGRLSEKDRAVYKQRGGFNDQTKRLVFHLCDTESRAEKEEKEGPRLVL